MAGDRERLIDAQREREQRLRSLTRLAGRMAHDFNNVLMGIQPFVEVLARQNPGNAGVQKAVERMGASIQRGKHLTDDVLALARPRPLVRKPFAVREWLQGVVEEARQQPGSSMQCELDGGGVLVIDGDAAQLRQAMMNLIANAREAMRGGGVLRIHAERGSGDGLYPFGAVDGVDRFAHLIVADSGPGMPAEAMEHLFEPMFTTKRPAPGMGLARTHQIVTEHSGELFVESSPGGTSVHLFLPLA